MENEWTKSELGEVAAVRSGYAFKSSDWKDTGVPVVKIANVKNGRLEMSGCSFVPQSIAAEAGEFQLATGDILIAMTGYIGEVARVRKADLPCVLNQRVGKFSVKNSKLLDADFLYTFLSFSETRKAIEALGYGTAQPNVSSSLIHKVVIPLPPLAEQKRIAGILGAFDDKIELNRKMNETLEQMIRTLFKSWFIDFDPVHAKTAGREPSGMDKATADLFPDSFVDSELGKIPRGWDVGTIGDIATSPRRSVQPSEIAPDTRYIGLEHVPRHSIALGEWGEAADIASGKSIFKKGEILFGKLRPYFHKVVVAPYDGVCSTDILVLSPKSRGQLGLLLGHASSDDLIRFADSASTGTKMPRTSWSDISSYKISLPSRDITDAFTLSIQPMLNRIHANLHQSRTLKALRDTLLPELLRADNQHMNPNL